MASDHIHVDNIRILEGRIRKEFDEAHLRDLADNIRDKGLMHPIVLRNDGQTLIAGERRVRACKLIFEEYNVSIYHDDEELPFGHIPFTRIGDPDDIAVREVELEENIIRKDLSWQERTKAIAELHELRHQQNPNQRPQQTASEILGRPAKPWEGTEIVRDAVLLRDRLNDPEISKARSQKEAMKIARKQDENFFRRALAESVEDSESASPHTLIQGDAIQEMQSLQGIDTIIADPPYGIDAQDFGDQAQLIHEYDDSYSYWQNLMQRFAVEAYNCTAPQAHLYVFCAFQNITELMAQLHAAGWQVWSTPLVWYKGNLGILPYPDYGPRRTYELIVFANKGSKPVARAGSHDVIYYPDSRTQLKHAAEKPVEVYINLLSRSCVAGDSVLDPFAGSGTIFPAADKLELKATGIEAVEAAVRLCRLRMEGEG